MSHNGTHGNADESILENAAATVAGRRSRAESSEAMNDEPAELGETAIPIFKGQSLVDSDGGDLRDQSQELARHAMDAFRDACSATDADTAEVNFLEARAALGSSWRFAKIRDIPFRDLLSALHTAIKYTDLSEYNDTQRDVLRSAFADLPRWHIDRSMVERHIEKFSEQDIDILGPLRPRTEKPFRVVIEEGRS